MPKQQDGSKTDRWLVSRYGTCTCNSL